MGKVSNWQNVGKALPGSTWAKLVAIVGRLMGMATVWQHVRKAFGRHIARGQVVHSRNVFSLVCCVP